MSTISEEQAAVLTAKIGKKSPSSVTVVKEPSAVAGSPEKIKTAQAKTEKTEESGAVKSTDKMKQEAGKEGKIR